MKPRLAVLSAVALMAASAVNAQQTPANDPTTVIPEKIEPTPPRTGPSAPRQPMRDSAPGQTSAAAESLPEGCRRAAAMAGHPDMPMDGGMPGSAPGAMERLTDTQRGLMEAMHRMHAGMMQGMTAADADVAWICAMIPHHQGAIDMARAGLKSSDNAESRRMAEETIRMQQEEIAKLTRWVQQNAERESRNENGVPARP